RELLVEAEEVLEGDRGVGDGLALDLEPLLRFHRLVDAVAPAAARHEATGELVDDDDLAVLDDVLAVDALEHLRVEGSFEMAGEARVVAEDLPYAEGTLDPLDAVFGQRHVLLL